MKKLTFILCLLLVSCSNKVVVQENNIIKEEQQQTATQTLEFGYSGFIGHEEMSMQYNQSDDLVFGKYKLNGLEIIFRGEHRGDVSFVSTENKEKMILTAFEETIYGVFLADKPIPVFASNAIIKPILSETSQSFKGRYTSYDSTFYEQTTIEVTPLFDHLFYLEILKGDKVLSFLALKNEGYFDLMTTDVRFEITEERELVFNKPLISSNESYDVRFSESIEIDSPSLLSLKLVEDELEEVFVKNLLGDYYDLFIFNSEIINHTRYNGYNQFNLYREEGDISIIMYEKNKSYYIWFDHKLIGRNRDLIMTNSIGVLPSFLSGEVVVKAMLINGYDAALTGSLDAFIPEGFLIKDKITGHINRDNKEDVVLILDHESIKDTRVLAILLNDGQSYTLDLLSDRAVLNQLGGGAFGEPYENIEIIDHKLIIELYGGSSTRWAQIHIFDTLFDYRLVKSELTNHDLESGNILSVTYDFVEDSVMVSDSSNIYNKKLKETLYLFQFDGEKLFDTGYK